MSLRVAATVESAWHRVPGGVANATHHSLRAVATQPDIELVGVHAWHRTAPVEGLVPVIPTSAIPLPRPVLYECWHRSRRPDVRRWTGPVDVVHATSAVIPPPSGAELVATVHDLAFLDRPDRSTTRGVRLARRGFELARDEATLVVVPSAASRAECVAAGIDADRIRLVPWGCRPTAVTDTDRARVRDRYSLPMSFILWVGTLEPRKNLAGLLAAHRAVPGVPLVVVGPAGWGDVDLPVSDRVVQLGFVPDADLAPLYDLATVFALPSHAEGFGMPVLEAMAQGAAVVTSSGTATEEVIGDTGVTVTPGDVEALADALLSLLDDAPKRARLGAAARERAGAFTWERTGLLLADVYREAVA